ncbi:MAG: hypothetical protein HUK09_06415, partial [Bacteroidaceae bacterium]|nr:hypothetical protein [Bacteroidaceae bacterium]
VYSARERDPQVNEAVVDNDQPSRSGTYDEWNTTRYTWQTAEVPGFAAPLTRLNDLTQPFRSGTVRVAKTTREQEESATATWTPNIPEQGRYAVYVSYATVENSVSDAKYTVYHAGGETTFRVNQRIGGGTWLYLGTFQFEQGISPRGRVVLRNNSRHKGVVTADAVRFGGGMGITERSTPRVGLSPDSIKVLTYGTGTTSALPRQLEAARYYAQWAGLPDTLYNAGQGQNDYADDIRSRAHLLNYLAGGSAFMPDTLGKAVPFELAFALHTDAGFNPLDEPYGTLTIATTFGDRGETTFRTGTDRRASLDLAGGVLQQLSDDLTKTFGKRWPIRELRDRNYGETRSPLVPSTIVELLSHQNFADMKYAHDPNFKFIASRAMYKSILRFVSRMHGETSPIIQPLPVMAFSARVLKGKNKVQLSWAPVADPLEPSAIPVEYIVYTKVGNDDYDNGQLTDGRTQLTLRIDPEKHYQFRVAAINAGGESFPSQPLSAYLSPYHTLHPTDEVLIVNAFNRLSGPAHVETRDSLGFDLDKDLGVPFDYTTAFAGRQIYFAPDGKGKEGPLGLGYSTSELVGQQIAGNRFDGVEDHASAISASMPELSISSMSSEAFAQLKFSELDDYKVLDYICGLERDVPYNLLPYKAFPLKAQEQIQSFMDLGGRVLVSGSFVGSDMQSPQEQQFLNQTLKVQYEATVSNAASNLLYGLDVPLPIYNQWNIKHFSATHTDVLTPVNGAFAAFAYGKDGYCAGVAYDAPKGRSITLGFPFECITDSQTRNATMQAMLRFLLK